MPRAKTTDAQRAAARANGAKSKGPASPQGKARSSANSTKHGLSATPPKTGLAASVVLLSEHHPAFLLLLNAYMDEYQPQGQTETDLVEEAVAAKWFQRRCWALQTAMIDLAMDRMDTADHHGALSELDAAARTALAFMEDGDRSQGLQLIGRYIARHGREYHRALDKLRAIQAERKAAAPQNENRQTNPAPAELPQAQRDAGSPAQPLEPAPKPATPQAPASQKPAPQTPPVTMERTPPLWPCASTTHLPSK